MRLPLFVRLSERLLEDIDLAVYNWRPRERETVKTVFLLKENPYTCLLMMTVLHC